MRARCAMGPDGMTVTAFEDQDSSRLAILADANALIVREIDAPAAETGATVAIVRLPS
jgi:molybdopterin molybdotransferase